MTHAQALIAVLLKSSQRGSLENPGRLDFRDYQRGPKILDELNELAVTQSDTACVYRCVGITSRVQRSVDCRGLNEGGGGRFMIFSYYTYFQRSSWDIQNNVPDRV